MMMKWPLGFAAFLGLLVSLVSYRFVFLGLESAFEIMIEHALDRRVLLLMHVSAAPVALAVGAFQFMPRIRRNHRALHRWLGRLYAVAILVGGIGAMGISLNAIGGLWAQVGFSALGIAWMGSTAIAIWMAMNKRFAEHRVWMLRSFALTFSAVTLRLQLVGFEILGLPYEQSSVWLAFTCWVPNLVVAEILIRTRPRIAA
jgi:hypothetical protein